jgi:hypothetical protein
MGGENIVLGLRDKLCSSGGSAIHGEHRTEKSLGFLDLI